MPNTASSGNQTPARRCHAPSAKQKERPTVSFVHRDLFDFTFMTAQYVDDSARGAHVLFPYAFVTFFSRVCLSVQSIQTSQIPAVGSSMSGAALLNLLLDREWRHLLLRENHAQLILNNLLRLMSSWPPSPKFPPRFASVGQCSSIQYL